MKILITGSSGLIGSALIRSLNANGHTTLRLLRNNITVDSPFWDPDNSIINMAGIKSIDAVVHLAGEGIAEGRWYKRKKNRILKSRVVGTKLIADFFAKSDTKPKVIISASGVGYYGDCGDNKVDENSHHGSGFLADVAKQWEDAALPAAKAGIRLVNIRLGMVLSSSGGALKKMIPPYKLGLAGIIGDGKQYMSWVCIDDVIEVIQYIINNQSITGPVNLVSPHPVTNHQFTKTLGTVLHRPTIFRMPAFAARLAFGEMADELLLSSTRAVPGKLTNSGYKFRYPELREAFEHLIR